MNTGAKFNSRHWGLLPFVLTCVGVLGLVARCAQSTAPTPPTATSTEMEHVHSEPATATVQSANVNALLAAVRNATARYHDVSAALADGYQLGYRGAVTGCVAKPGTGAMGYHYFNWAKMDDPAIVADDPEVLVYHTGDDGTLVLGAVEWVVPKATWDAAGNTAPPVVFGQSLHILNPVLNWYVEHAWVWTENPSGLFADWNPNVGCP